MVLSLRNCGFLLLVKVQLEKAMVAPSAAVNEMPYFSGFFYPFPEKVQLSNEAAHLVMCMMSLEQSRIVEFFMVIVQS